jgi:hypothetical protein
VSSAGALDQAVGEIRGCVLEPAQSLPCGFRILHGELLRTQDVLENVDDLASRAVVAAFEHPHELGEDDR